MKKIIFYGIILFLSVPFIFSYNEKNKDQSKIIFEDYGLKAMSIDQEITDNLTNVSTEKIDILVKFNYEQFTFGEAEELNGPSTLTKSQVSKIKKALFSAGKSYYTSHNQELMKKIDTTRMSNLYVSTYSPFFSFTIESRQLSSIYQQDLKSLDSKSYIDTISIGRTPVYQSMLSNAKTKRGVDYVNDTMGYTGDGVKVGIMENGILDKNHVNFANKNVYTHNQMIWIETTSTHATTMASIIGGNYGIAPDVSVYSTQVFGGVNEEVDWLLDQEVDIINMSFGEENPTGIYNSTSAYMDFIVKTYKVICVASAGNDGQTTGHVGNPGLGYNVLTVGTTDCDYVSRANFSSYVTVTGPAKPNVMAPGALSVANISGSSMGTSNSAAFTTGCIALLLDYIPGWKLYPEVVYALLCATADTFNTNERYLGLHDEYGTGSLFIKAAMQNVGNTMYGKNNNVNLNRYVNRSYDTGDKIKAVAWWLANADGNVNNTVYSDYDIFINTEFYGNLIDSNGADDNVEHFEKEIPQTGNYDLGIAHCGNTLSQSNEYYAMVYFVMP